MVTDFDYGAVPVRSIPPQYKGISIYGGLLYVDIVITKAPLSDKLELYDFEGVGGEQAWAGGWVWGIIWLYVDEFEWNSSTGAQEPDLEILKVFQNDLIEGAVHAEYNRPKRLLHRESFILPGAVDATSVIEPGAGNDSIQSLQNRAQLHQRKRIRIPRCALSERESLWICTAYTNP